MNEIKCPRRLIKNAMLLVVCLHILFIILQILPFLEKSYKDVLILNSLIKKLALLKKEAGIINIRDRHIKRERERNGKKVPKMIITVEKSKFHQ